MTADPTPNASSTPAGSGVLRATGRVLLGAAVAAAGVGHLTALRPAVGVATAVTRGVSRR
ncbi:hypothetical protein [Tessaracoccus sp. Z1128]